MVHPAQPTKRHWTGGRSTTRLPSITQKPRPARRWIFSPTHPPPLPDPDVSSDIPTLEEVKAAINRLRNGKVAGPDHVPPELQKCAINPISSVLHKLFTRVWQSGRVPAEWKEGIIITLYKGKGSRAECSRQL